MRTTLALFFVLFHALSCTKIFAQQPPMDADLLKRSICMHNDAFDSLIEAKQINLDTGSVIVTTVSSADFAQVCKGVAKKRVIIYLWSSWCHFSTDGIAIAEKLNNATDTVLFIACDITSPSQIKYLKKVSAYYKLPSTYLINSDFSVTNPRDPDRVKHFFKVFKSKYSGGGYPYYMLLDQTKTRVAKEGGTLRQISR